MNRAGISMSLYDTQDGMVKGTRLDPGDERWREEQASLQAPADVSSQARRHHRQQEVTGQVEPPRQVAQRDLARLLRGSEGKCQVQGTVVVLTRGGVG